MSSHDSSIAKCGVPGSSSFHLAVVRLIYTGGEEGAKFYCQVTELNDVRETYSQNRGR
jgi:hypothetical protein